MGKIKSFVGNVRSEMNNVTWPTGAELRKNTVTVFGVCILFVIFFMIVDFGITSILELFL